MTSRSLRRLAADHGALHSQPLPPNYLFLPGADAGDDLTQLDILLAGPTHTPYASGVWKLHLSIPADYPQQPPTANFRTPIFHPNVEPQTGGVCVETLKRDWDPKLTLRDVLVTISCLLIQPNPDSALNAEAGSLIQENYDAFARRAELMTSIHGVVPKALRDAVKEAQMRGQEAEPEEHASKQTVDLPAAPARRRRPTARQRGTTATRRSDGSPTADTTRRRHPPEQVNPFVVQPKNDDVFGTIIPDSQEPSIFHEDDSSMLMDADQENDETRSPKKPIPPRHCTPKRPPGAAVPLGELTLDDDPSSSEVEDSMEAEYPPSPKKHSSPLKSPAKRPPQQLLPRAESSRDAAARNITPTTNPFTQTLAHDSPYALAAQSPSSTSPRKLRMLEETPKRGPLFPTLRTPREKGGGIFKTKLSPTSAEKKAREKRKKEERDRRLWELCSGDVRRWNRGDFAGEPFGMKARRW